MHLQVAYCCMDSWGEAGVFVAAWGMRVHGCMVCWSGRRRGVQVGDLLHWARLFYGDH